MAKEIEGRIIGVDAESAKKILEKLKVEFIGGYYFRRYVFDTIPTRNNRWVRLRTNGKKSTLAVKEITNHNAEGTDEWEVEVDNFDTTLDILKKSVYLLVVIKKIVG